MSNSLRDEIDQELFRLWIHAVNGGYSNPDDPIIQKWLKQSSDQILNLVASKMPEKKEYPPKPDDYNENISWLKKVLQAEGYNQAITEVKSILKGRND